MYTKFTSINIALLSVLWLTLTLVTGPVLAKEKETQASGTYLITEVKTEIDQESLTMVIAGDSSPAFTKYETFGPFRIVVDIAQAKLAETLDQNNLLPDNEIAKLTTMVKADQTPPILRFEFEVPDNAPYSVSKNGNSISISIQKGTAQTLVNAEAASQPQIVLKNLDITDEEGQTKVLITANKTIKQYTSDSVPGNSTSPDRMFIDLKDVDGVALPREKKVEGSVLEKVRIAKKGNDVRVVFDSGMPGLFQYTINPDPNGLAVTLSKPTAETKNINGEKPSSVHEHSSDNTLDSLLASSSTVIKDSGKEEKSVSVFGNSELLDKYDFAGYKSKRISIDFYKIDIHNIFRLLREITDLNIVVDEAVTGTLTLALNDVPWDFALDIILNLTDLEKEERFNTIVIYPKKKKFNWPKRGADNLDVEVDLEVIEEEALIIQQAASQPKEIIEAKSLMKKALAEEKRNRLESAAKLYEQASELWPANFKITNKLASLYLVGLRVNAKAVYFAQKSLKIDPQNTKAALYSAIGMANMNQLPEAMEYFNQAVSSTPPTKEALVSYATFSENNDQPEAALKLLNTYNTYYGDTLETMVARARIYDKMGNTDKATAQYQTILNSGFQIRPDLKKFIRGRVATKNLTTSN